VVIPRITSKPVQLASALLNSLPNINYMDICITVPLVLQSFDAAADPDSGSTVDRSEAGDTWKRWNLLRTLSHFHPQIGIALELTEDLPSDVVLDRWIGEPIKMVIVPTSIFTTQRNGRPTLSPRHAKLISRLFEFTKIRWVLRGRADAAGLADYADCLCRLHAKMPQYSDNERLERMYMDYLQSPLQPLKDNLESQTYEIFEKDPVKYVQYEEAVKRAIEEKVGWPDLGGKPKAESINKKPLVVMVLGAGRGPLVKASLRAAKRADYPIKVYAVEKNPNAVCTLLNARQTLGWGDQVCHILCIN
jgi:protein arginine N-methyltransferase 5